MSVDLINKLDFSDILTHQGKAHLACGFRECGSTGLAGVSRIALCGAKMITRGYRIKIAHLNINDNHCEMCKLAMIEGIPCSPTCPAHKATSKTP